MNKIKKDMVRHLAHTISFFVMTEEGLGGGIYRKLYCDLICLDYSDIVGESYYLLFIHKRGVCVTG